MMTDHEMTLLTLTDEQMDEITTAARTSWVDAVVLTFRCFGVDLLDKSGPPVKPSMYAIPEEQWGRISTACGESSSGSLSAVNHMLDWMNYGPSAFTPTLDTPTD